MAAAGRAALVKRRREWRYRRQYRQTRETGCATFGGTRASCPAGKVEVAIGMLAPSNPGARPGRLAERSASRYLPPLIEGNSSLIMVMAAGPTSTTKIAGKMNNTSGKISFTAVLAAFSSAN